MYSWESRSSKKRKRNRILLVIFVIVVVTLPLFVGSAGLIKLMKLKREKHALTRQISILKAEKEVLEQRAEMYLKDDKIIERKARDELGMIREGERIFQIQPAEKQ